MTRTASTRPETLARACRDLDAEVKQYAKCHRATCAALARHLGTEPTFIEPNYALRADLGLDRLDLAFIALRIGDRLQIHVPFSALEGVVTVADLAALAFRVLAASSRVYRRALGLDATTGTSR